MGIYVPQMAVIRLLQRNEDVDLSVPQELGLALADHFAASVGPSGDTFLHAMLG